MIGSRTRHSLAQFLELQEPAVSLVLLSKYGVLLDGFIVQQRSGAEPQAAIVEFFPD